MYTEFSRNVGSLEFRGIVLKVLWGNSCKRTHFCRTNLVLHPQSVCWEQNSTFCSPLIGFHKRNDHYHIQLLVEADVILRAEYRSCKANQKTLNHLTIIILTLAFSGSLVMSPNTREDDVNVRVTEDTDFIHAHWTCLLRTICTSVSLFKI